MFDSVSGLVDIVKEFIATYPAFIAAVGELVAIVVNLLKKIKSLKSPQAEAMAAQTKCSCPHSHWKTLGWACLPWNVFRKA